MPILSSFRSIIKKDVNGKLNFELNPIEVFDQLKYDILSRFYNSNRTSPETIGKDKLLL